MTEIQLPTRAQDILDGKMPEKMRSGIATGALPMPPIDLVSCLAVIAAKDSNPELRSKAQATLAELPPDMREAAVGGELAPPVFRVAFKFMQLEKQQRQTLALNGATPDDVITMLATTENDAAILEIISENQTRMLRHIPLVEALLDNPSLGPAAKARLEEFFARAYSGKVLLQQGLKTKEELSEEDDWDADLLEAVEESAREDTDGDDQEIKEFLAPEEEEEIDEELAAELLEQAAKTEDEGTDEDEIDMSNLRKAVQKMKVPQKIKLAIMGNKEARSLLILDGNKVVSSMVLKNPRISEKEIVAISSSKSVREDMLRSIARDRKFMKSYSVKLALVENAKTPPSMALNLLTQLRDNDLKRISRSKSVSNNISTQAKRMLVRKAGQNKKKK